MPKGNLKQFLPSNIEAEKSLLASILISQDALYDALSKLSPDDFYQPSNRLIYEAILNLSKSGKAIDLVIISEELSKTDKIDEIGGVGYLAEVADFVPTPSIAESYIEIIKEKSLLRKIITASNELLLDGYNGKFSAEELLSEAERKIFNIASYKLNDELVPVAEYTNDVANELEKLHKSKGSDLSGISTGFGKLDEMTSGLQNGDLIIIAGRPGMGKTSFALNIAQYASLDAAKNVAFFSLEMSRKQLVFRLVSSIGKIDSYLIRTGRFKNDQWTTITDALDRLSAAKLYIDDTPSTATMQIAAKCRKAKLQHGLDLIIIDYLQLIKMREKERKDLEISETTRSLKIMAKELNVPVILISQLNRAPEARDNKRPRASDLRESGAIEQDADLILFVYRDSFYKRDKENDDKTAEIIIGKQRNGPVGTVKLVFINEYTSFENRSTEEYFEE